MSTVVVTGASGFLGRRVVGLLVDSGAGPGVIGVDLVPPDLHADGDTRSAPVEHRVLDLARAPRERLLATFDGADRLVHLAWSHGEVSSSSSGHSRERSLANLESLRRVLEVAEQTGITSLVHISSATVYGAWPDNPVPLPEDAALRPNPAFLFAVEKAEAERMLADWADDHAAVAVAILRPTVTVGMSTAAGSAGLALNQALAGTWGPRPDDGGRPLQFLHVDDLAAAAIRASGMRLRGIYNVAPDGWITEDNARALAGGVARVILPGRLVRLLATVGWDLMRTGTPKEALPYSVHPWVVANDRLRASGWVPAYTNEEALVNSDECSRWRDMPPNRRQQLTLLAASSTAIAAAGLVVAGATAVVTRARRLRRVRRTRRQEATAKG